MSDLQLQTLPKVLEDYEVFTAAEVPVKLKEGWVPHGSAFPHDGQIQQPMIKQRDVTTDELCDMMVNYMVVAMDVANRAEQILTERFG